MAKHTASTEATYTLPAGCALVLRCCNADMTSRDGFVWPGVGETATAPDWRDDTAADDARTFGEPRRLADYREPRGEYDSFTSGVRGRG